MQRFKKNQCYKIGCAGNEIKKVFQKSCTPDRSYMNEQMKVHLDYLDQQGISEYENFVQTLRDYQFSAGSILKLMQAFVDYKNSQDPSRPLFLLKPRELKKANAGEKNILFNRLSVEYSFEFLSFFENYVKFYFPLMKIKNKLIENFRTKVERLVEMRNKKNDDKVDPDSNDSYEVIDSIPYENEINADDDFFIFGDDQSADFSFLFTNDGVIDEIFGE
ncbi:hypothetical protein M9Y10_010954 [Tritrichomonas musculus]|uniref:Initiator binding domain-containing protein n=1 Tax=Tritrichomonas musculus TaxID=1915356 RepID=A0ABR2IM86_9EUKA